MAASFSIKWVKRELESELELCRKLGADLKGCLDGLRDLYCRRGGNLPNDLPYLAATLGVSVQKMRPWRAKLIELGCMAETETGLELPLAYGDYWEAAGYYEQKRQAGVSSGRKRGAVKGRRDRVQPSKSPPQELIPQKPSNSADPPGTLVGTSMQPESQTFLKKEIDAAHASTGEIPGIADILRTSDDTIIGRTVIQDALEKLESALVGRDRRMMSH